MMLVKVVEIFGLLFVILSGGWMEDTPQWINWRSDPAELLTADGQLQQFTSKLPASDRKGPSPSQSQLIAAELKLEPRSRWDG